ncbi:hypothetical protein B0A52_09906 [Exophiala mesophila]|uniref:Dihydroneopterin aldolase/epimerase domain-containing protein n=1 Tax=Exophiala mesophila TaxID=212818 RepID=A0A438MQS3_EXOME|nr:hypothetical protein B0A52_09906 [Exophiala mesophila]
MDSVILKGIRFDLAVGLDAWRRVAKPQPVIVDLDIQPTFTLEAAAAKDDLSLTLDYGKPYKQLVKEANETLTYPDIRYLISHISDVVADYASLSLEISLPKALLQAKEGLAYHAMIDKSPDAGTVFTLSLTIKQIAAECIIGVNPHERTYKQPLFFDISVPIVAGSFEIVGEHDVGHHHQVHDLVQEVVEVRSVTLCQNVY